MINFFIGFVVGAMAVVVLFAVIRMAVKDAESGEDNYEN